MHSFEGSIYQGIVPPELLPLALAVFLFLAAAYDGLYQRIPNRLVLGGLLVALLLQLLFHSGAGVLAALGGMLLGLALLLPFYALSGMAAGDVKLMAAIGAFLGPQYTFYALIGSFLVGGVWAAVVVTRRKKWKKILAQPLHLPARRAAGFWQGAHAPPSPGELRLGEVESAVGHLPYGVVIAIGTSAVLLLRWYFSSV